MRKINSKRTEGLSDFKVKNANLKGKSIQHWLIMRSLEYLSKQEEHVEVPDTNVETEQEKHVELHVGAPQTNIYIGREEQVGIPEANENNMYQDPLLPSFAALNSFVRDIDLGITDIFTITLIPGPASL